MRNRRRSSRRRFWLSISAFLFLSSDTTCQAHQNETDPRPRLAVHGYCRPPRSQDDEVRLTFDPSFVDRLPPSDFSQRLRREQQLSTKLSRKSTKRKSSLLSSSYVNGMPLSKMVFTTGTLWLVSALVAPGSTLWADLWTLARNLSSLWLLLPMVWLSPSSSWLSDAHRYIASLGSGALIDWGAAQGTLRKIVASELWSRFWSIWWKQLLADFPSTGSQRLQQCDHWLLQCHAQLHSLLQRGTKRLVQSTLQRHMQKTLVEALQWGVDLARRQWTTKASS